MPCTHPKAIPVYTLTQDVRLIVGHIFVQGGPPISPVDLSFPHTEPTSTFFFFQWESFYLIVLPESFSSVKPFSGEAFDLMLRFYSLSGNGASIYIVYIYIYLLYFFFINILAFIFFRVSLLTISLIIGSLILRYWLDSKVICRASV